MMGGAFSRARSASFEPPIEMRFVDLFMIIVTVLMFVAVLFAIIAALHPGPSGTNPVPKITTTSMPDALVNQPYALTLAVSGGTGPYVWKLVGRPTEGLVLDGSTGVVSGTPKKIERTQFIVELMDANKISTSKEFALDVRSVGQITPVASRIRMTAGMVTLPDAIRGTSYDFRLKADGGSPPYQWTITGGQLDAGMEVTRSGEVVGVATGKNDMWDFSVTATDATGAKLDQNVRLNVIPPPESLGRRILRWTNRIIIWIGYVLVFLMLVMMLVGQPGGYVEAKPGLIGRLFGKR